MSPVNPGLLQRYNTKQAQIQRKISEQVNNTLGNEIRDSAKLRQKINDFQMAFHNNALKSGKYPALVEYNKKRRLNTHFNKIIKRLEGTGSRSLASMYRQIPQKVRAEMDTIRLRGNTAIRRNMRKELALLDKNNKRIRTYSEGLQKKYDPEGYSRYQKNLKNRQQQNKKFIDWAKKNDPRFYTQHQKFIKKHGANVNTPRQNVLGSSTFINRYEYDKSRDAAERKHFDFIFSGFRDKLPLIASTQPTSTTGKFKPIKPPVKTVPKKPILDIMSNVKKPQKFDLGEGAYKPTTQVASQIKKPKKYNQASYLAGLQQAPMTMGQKMNQGIAKPYANGGGVRKPKYNKKG